MSAWSKPLILGVAPNGGRKSPADFPGLPITPEQTAAAAKAAQAAGAALIHLHVRDAGAGHSLDAGLYGEATRAVRAAVGDDMIIQMTTESLGLFTPDEQMAAVRAVKPEAASLAIKELVPDAAAENGAAEFFYWMMRHGIQAQYILYSPEEVARFQDLRLRGVVPDANPFVLFVLGRYAKDQRSQASDLLPFLAVDGATDANWAICAFGPLEAACATAAMSLGGHARIGFENNVFMPDGSRAPDNAALISLAADAARAIGRPLASAAQARAMLKASR